MHKTNQISTRKRQLLYSSLLWACVLVLLSVQPDHLVLRLLPTDLWKQIAHGAAYGFFAFLLCFLMRFLRHIGAIRMTDFNAICAATLLSFSWGVLTECIQLYIPDRYFDPEDMLMNIIGIAGGVLIYMVFKVLHHHHLAFHRSLSGRK